VVPGDAPGITLCAAATSRLSSEGLPTDTEEQTTCCYAVQDKVWVTGPGAERWEVYTVLADSQPELEGQSNAADGCDTSDGCCAPARSDDSSKTADLAAESQGCC